MVEHFRIQYFASQLSWYLQPQRDLCGIMVPFAMSDDKPYPACKWRQADAHFKKKKGVIVAKSVHEALVYDRPFCSARYPFMPAHVLGILSESHVQWKSR